MSLLFFIWSMIICGQQHQFHIKNIWLYTEAQYNGNVPVNKGNRTATANASTKLKCFIIVEKGQPSPTWETAEFGNRKYTVSALVMAQDSVVVGLRKDTKEPVVIKTTADSQLIQLTLEPTGDVEPSEVLEFVLSGTFNHKRVQVALSNQPIELTPVFMP